MKIKILDYSTNYIIG